MEVKDILKMLTKENVISIMGDLYGATYKHNPDGSIAFESICHNSTSQKLYYYHEPRDEEDIGRNFYCYVCNVSGNIINLIMELSGLKFKDAIKIIEDELGIKTSFSRQVRGIQRKAGENEDLKFLAIHTKKKREHRVVETKFDDSVLNDFLDMYPVCWQEEGIDGYSAEKFDIRYNYQDNQAVIPVRNLDGDLVGIRVRNFEDYAVDRGYKYMPLKYMGIDYKFPTSNIMYGLYENQENIKRCGKVFLFEGEKSCLLTDSFYDGNGLALAVYGSNFSVQHRDILLSLGVKEVTIAFDKEYQAEWYGEEYNKTKEQTLMFNYFKKLKKMAKMLSNYFIVNIVIDFNNRLDLKDSPVDKGKEVFEELLREKITITDVDEDFREIFDI